MWSCIWALLMGFSVLPSVLGFAMQVTVYFVKMGWPQAPNGPYLCKPDMGWGIQLRPSVCPLVKEKNISGQPSVSSYYNWKLKCRTISNSSILTCPHRGQMGSRISSKAVCISMLFAVMRIIDAKKYCCIGQDLSLVGTARPHQGIKDADGARPKWTFFF